MNRLLGVLFVTLVFAPAVTAEEEPTIGLPARITVVLPGPELEARPLEGRKAPLVLRIIDVEWTAEGRRYELEYTGLVPGRFDLRDFLRRKDGSRPAGLPSLPVSIQSVLPPGQEVPNPLAAPATPRPGGYWRAVLAGAVLWGVGLLAVLWLVWRGRRRRSGPVAAAPATLADTLRPLIEDALAGRADPGRLAELERRLIAYWRRQLALGDQPPAEALTVLHRHAEAGPLLGQLESWLHSPAGAGMIDVNGLLEPYRRLPANALEVSTRP
jgi:hypothetical protein